MKINRIRIFCLSVFCIFAFSACSMINSRNESSSINYQKTINALQQQLQTQDNGNNSQDSSPTPGETEAILEPTFTPFPTATQDPNPTLVLPFSDNFDIGLDSAWRIDYGNPIVLDGRLAAAGDQLVIEIGNSSLSRYTLEFDVWGKDENYCGMGYFEYVTINFSPTLQYIFNYVDYSGSGGWNDFENNEWTRVSRKDGLECGQMRFIVDNTSYQLYINGQLIDQLVYTGAQGPLVITIDETVTIDNLEIK